jgi:hypothetical protein
MDAEAEARSEAQKQSSLTSAPFEAGIWQRWEITAMAIVTFEPGKTQSNWLFPSALVVFSAAAAWQASSFTGLAFKPFRAEEIVGNLTALFLISVFLERALEVFVAWWRDADRLKLEQEVAHADADAKTASDAAAAQRLVREKQHKLDDFKTQTGRRSFMWGLAAGAVIALAGARALGPLLVELPPDGSLQLLVVTFVDVVITAGLIGGGSDGIHKLVSVITDYLDTARANLAAKAAK